ncbi:tyrosine-type recombinase/integrase [Inquilinus sp. CA228]|uniref:tyrosine-type recombinase/integrase n=1 Tax=Inquilinus sp. CA228 TaxID=3455609 RepID=UPI003F8D3BB1
MAAVKLKHVNTFPDRHGKLRSYFRFPGQKAVSLPGRPGSPDFMTAYNVALGFAPQIEAAPDRTKFAASDRTFAALVAKYKETEIPSINAARSKKTVTGILDRFVAKHGTKSVVRMSVDDCVTEVFGKMKDRPGAHNNLLSRFRILIQFAIDLGWRQTDPSKRVKPMKLGTWHTWNEEEIELFEKRFEIGTRERTAFELFLHTGQRVSDVCKMSWRHFNEERGTITVAQAKAQAEQNDTSLEIVCNPDLAAALAAWKATCLVEKRPVSLKQTIITTEIGGDYIAKSFGDWMANLIDDAKLPDRCVPHGLRKAACRRLAEAGCSANEIMSITGHKTLREVERYCKMADQLRLSGNVARKMREHFRREAEEADAA